MSETSTPQKKKTAAAKWSMAQKLGFWFLLTAVTFSFLGYAVGGSSAVSERKALDDARAQAVAEYQAELK